MSTNSTVSSIISSISSATLDSSSSVPPSSSSVPVTSSASSSSVPASTTPTPSSTSTVIASTAPPVTDVITSVVTQSSSGADSTAPLQTSVVVITRTQSQTSQPTSSTSSSTSTTPPASLNTGSSSGDSSGGGLSTAGTTAIAVVVPVVVVALLVLAGIFFWRRRKQKKAAEEARRNEVEDYGFNPNNDPTLPAVASESGHEMTEDSSGYRGWGAAGAAGAMTNSRKMSTTLSGGHTAGQLSDAGSNGYHRNGNSPNGGISEQSGDPLMQDRRNTMNSDDLGALGAAPVAGANQSTVHRGPSNASSTYSAAGRTDVSDEGPGGMPQSYEAYNPNTGYGYSQHGPYGDGTYGGTGQEGGMPIVRDVSARRNTRIQQPGNYQQGNSGIAQNF